MVCFDPKALPRMQPTKAFLQCLNELVVGCHGTTVVLHERSRRTEREQKEQKTSQYRLLDAHMYPRSASVGSSAIARLDGNGVASSPGRTFP
jgi:hypothetical protein